MAELRDAELKLRWAQERLVQVEALVAEYRATEPYAVRRHVEGKRKKERWRLHITADPPPEVALVLGEFLYNVRSSLDYIAADLVRDSMRSKSYYPMLNERVWEIPLTEGENEQRSADRRRWAFVEREMPAAAVEIIKSFHAPDGRPKRSEPMYGLSVLNALSNKDRHRNLSVISAGLDHDTMEFEFVMPDGTSLFAGGELDSPIRASYPIRRAYAHGAQVRTPPGVADVKVHGTVSVGVNVSPEWAHIRVPEDFPIMWRDAASILGHLIPLIPDRVR